MISTKSFWSAPASIWAYRFLIASAFCAPFSLPAGRIFLALALLTLVYARIRYRQPITFNRVCFLWLAYVLIGFLVSLQGINPERSLGDLSKLYWFMGIPVAATLIHCRQRATVLLMAYMSGSLIRALDILLIRVPEAWHAAEEGEFVHQIIDRGSMNHGQILALGMVAAAGLGLFALAQRQGIRKILWQGGQFLLLSLAMILNFKRGSWAAVTLTLGIFGLLTRRWRLLLILVALVSMSAFHPYVRQRVSQLRSEFNLQHGGRLVMWTQIAPELLRQHPYGVGFRGVTADVMQSTAKSLGVRVEENRNHLHSNFVEIPVTMGWAAFVIYLLWMGLALTRGFHAAAMVPDTTMRILPITYCMLLLSLILNGIVEYNMADAYLVLPYGILLGVLSNAPRIFKK